MKKPTFIFLWMFCSIIFASNVFAQEVAYDRFEDITTVTSKNPQIGKGFFAGATAKISGDATKPGWNRNNVKSLDLVLATIGPEYEYEGITGVKAIIDNQRLEFTTRWAGNKTDMMAGIPSFGSFHPKPIIKSTEWIHVGMSLDQLRKVAMAKSAEFKVGVTEVRLTEEAQTELKKLIAFLER